MSHVPTGAPNKNSNALDFLFSRRLQCPNVRIFVSLSTVFFVIWPCFFDACVKKIASASFPRVFSFSSYRCWWLVLTCLSVWWWASDMATTPPPLSFRRKLLGESASERRVCRRKRGWTVVVGPEVRYAKYKQLLIIMFYHPFLIRSLIFIFCKNSYPVQHHIFLLSFDLSNRICN